MSERKWAQSVKDKVAEHLGTIKALADAAHAGAAVHLSSTTLAETTDQQDGG